MWVLLRHGKSRWDEPVTDHERGLTPRGRRDAVAVGTWLARHIDEPMVLSSTARRAAETARWACEAAGWDPPALDDQLYGAGVGDLNAVGAAYDHVMLVGHNPTLDAAVQSWVDDPPQPADGKIMTTATAAILDRDARRLVAWRRPKDVEPTSPQ